MISIDTNILFHAFNADSPLNEIYDVRIALILIEHGVTDFATINLKNF